MTLSALISRPSTRITSRKLWGYRRVVRRRPRARTHYNYFRDYDPQTGRYVESDPIGLDGGSYSTYLYAKGNPLWYHDTTGECPWCIAGAVIGAGFNALNNYRALENGQITGWQYAQDIVVGAGTGFISGIPGGYALSIALGAATATANEGIQELVNGGCVNSRKIAASGVIGAVGGALGPLFADAGSAISRPVIGQPVTAPFGYPNVGGSIGFGLASLFNGLPIPDYRLPGVALMNSALRATLTLLCILAVCWVLLRLALPYLSYERIAWAGAIFFLGAGIVVILRSRLQTTNAREVEQNSRGRLLEGCFYLAVAMLIAIASSLVFKQR